MELPLLERLRNLEQGYGRAFAVTYLKDEIVAVLESTELAWAAGFFDGEGSTGCYEVSRRDTSVFRLAVAQFDRRPIARFVAALGVPTNITQQGAEYRVSMSGTKALQALRRLWPYLSEPKREQALGAFKQAHARRARTRPSTNAAYDEAALFLGVSHQFSEHP